jgi:4-carboxymuconolactone decarboxylase
MTSSATPRFPIIPEAQWTNEQKLLVEEYRKSWRGPQTGADGKSLGGPLDSTFRSPELASRIGKVSDFIREKSEISEKLKEFVIILVSQHWKCAFEIRVHGAFALKAGLAPSLVEAVFKDVKPPSMSEDEEVVYAVIMDLLTTHQLSDSNFEKGVKTFGEKQLIELVAIAGYYTMVAMFFATAKVT